jgi:LuxR family transcriptional regulator, maltose regulon positive regulatory protein
MQTPVALTKILVPRRRSDLLSRMRLLVLLDNLLDYRITLIAAPAGYGKTSLLVDFADQVEFPICWYALDPLDADLPRFILHFISSIQQRFPNFGESSLAVLQSSQQAGLDLAHLVTTIVNDVYENISEHFAIVLDDYHLVDDCEEINLFVSRFGQEMDENCHLIIASRTLMSLPDLPLMVGRSQAIGLSFEELAFRAHEIKALLAQNYNQSISDEEAKELVNETEGWITGLLLSAETMWQGMADRVRVARVSGINLYDYLAQQVLNQQPANIRDFLLRTSLLEEFDEDLCQSVLGNPQNGVSWSHLIAAVLRSNLFVQPVGNRGTWLRYHHLFRDFLQDQLKTEQPGEELRILYRLVNVYTEQEDWEKAYAISQRLGDDEIKAKLIEQASPKLARSGRMKKLGEWLDDLPEGVINSFPYLLAQRGIVYTHLGSVEQGLKFLNKAEALLLDTGEKEALARTITWRATSYRFLGNYEASLEDAEKVLGLFDGFDAIRAEAMRIKGLALHSLGRMLEAFEPLEQSLTIYNSLADQDNIAITHMDLGFAFMSIGDSSNALHHYHLALDLWQKTKNLTRKANLLNNLGVLAHAKGDLLQAESYFSEALTCARQAGYTRIEAFTLASQGDLLADLAFYEAAIECYRKSRQIAEKLEERFLLLYLGLANTKLARMQGKIDEAFEKLHKVETFAKESKSSYSLGLWFLEQGTLLLKSGEITEAIAAEKKTISYLKNGGQKIEAAQALIYLALAQYQGGNQESAIASIVEAASVASSLESYYPLIVTGKDSREMLDQIKNNPKVHVFTRDFLQQIEEFEEALPQLRRQIRRQGKQDSFAPPDISIHALGQAQIYLNGEVLDKPEWSNQKTVRELFFLLLANHDGMTKEAIGLNLWPESTIKQLVPQLSKVVG